MYELDTATVKGKCCKRSPSWKGPGIIVKKLTPHLYQVKTKSAVIVANHDRLKKCVDRDIPHEWFGLGRTLRTLGAKRETGSDLAPSPPAGAGACKLPESLDSTPSQRPRRGRPPKRSDSPPLPPDVGGVPVTDLT